MASDHLVPAALFLALSTVACGGGAGEPGDSLPVVGEGDTSASGTVDEGGGILRLADGSAVVVPPGAVSGATALSLSSALGAPQGAPAGPDGRAPLWNVLTVTPHGQVFARPVELRLWPPPGLPGERVSLFTQAGDGTAWSPVAGVTFREDGLAAVETDHLSHWAWFAEPGGAAAIADSALVDPENGVAYYVAYNPPSKTWELRRASLAAGASFETLFVEAPGSTLTVVAQGPEGLFFLRDGPALLARMSLDGSELDPAWANLAGQATYFKRGFVTATHVYFDHLRVPLATGVPEESPFPVSVSGGCALSADRARAGCTGYELDLVGETSLQPRDEFHIQVPNGDVATDGTHWYFMTAENAPEGRVLKVAYGSSEAVTLLDTSGASRLALSGTTLLVGGDSGITAYDSTSGSQLGQAGTSTLGPVPIANALLSADATTVYYAGYGTTLGRLPLAELLP